MKYLLLLVVLMSGPLFASGDDIDTTAIASVENATSVTTGGSNASVGGSDNFSLGYGPDNDINDCMAHWSVVIVTFPKRNKFCERQEFVRWAEAPNFHTPNSIRIMCSDPMGKEVFGSTLECISVFTQPDIPTPIPTPGPDEDGYRPDEAGEVSECGECRPPVDDIVQTQMVQVAEDYEGLEQRLARIERGNRIAAQKAQARRAITQQTLEALEDESER